MNAQAAQNRTLQYALSRRATGLGFLESEDYYYEDAAGNWYYQDSYGSYWGDSSGNYWDSFGDGGYYYDPYSYDLFAAVRSDRTLEQVETALLDELERLANDSITKDELDKAIKQSKAQFAYAAERVTNQAYWIGQSEIVDSYHWFETYIDRLMAVTVEQVRQCVQKYLQPANRTVGWYVPLDAEKTHTG